MVDTLRGDIGGMERRTTAIQLGSSRKRPLALAHRSRKAELRRPFVLRDHGADCTTPPHAVCAPPGPVAALLNTASATGSPASTVAHP